MADQRARILDRWRSILFELERRIADYGGDQTPLHLLSLRDNARAEIEKLESDISNASVDSVVPSATELSIQLDYRFQMDKLRQDVSLWEASMAKELAQMTDEQIRPLQTMLFEMSRRLDTITQTMSAIQQENAVISHRLGRLESDFGGEDRQRVRWLVYLALAILGVSVVMVLLRYLNVLTG